MILPVHIIGSPVLRKKAKNVDRKNDYLKKLIKDMKKTMLRADGIGLAAPQVGHSISLFIVNTLLLEKDYPDSANFERIFINAQITELSDELITVNEGCLSIPDISEDVKRSAKITVEYLDENFNPQKEKLEGIIAVIVQHEYDHIDGIMFTDRVAPVRRKFLKRKLINISKGKFEKRYKYILKKK